MSDDQERNSLKAAPYTAFASVKTALRYMKEHGTPGRIDRTVLSNFSGSVGSQVMTAFRFLQLTENDRTTDALRTLVDAIDDEQKWAMALAPVLKAAYTPLFGSNLETMSAGEFRELFNTHFPATDNVQRKSIAFFLNAAREANISISKWVTKGSKPRSAPTRKKTPRAAPKGDRQTGGAPPPPPPAPAAVAKPLEYQLLDLIAADMDDATKTSVWTVINYLKSKPQK